MAHPLDKLPEETARSYQAFLDLYRLGPGAILKDLLQQYRGRPDGHLKPPTKNLSTLKKWSKQHNWQSHLHDAHVQMERERLDSEEQTRQQLWAERQAHVLEADYQLAEQLRTMVESTLEQIPNFIKTQRRVIPGQDGQPDREIVTLSIKEHALLRAIEILSKLQRQSTGLHDVTRVEGTAEDGSIQITLSGNISPDDF